MGQWVLWGLWGGGAVPHSAPISPHSATSAHKRDPESERGRSSALRSVGRNGGAAPYGVTMGYSAIWGHTAPYRVTQQCPMGSHSAVWGHIGMYGVTQRHMGSQWGTVPYGVTQRHMGSQWGTAPYGVTQRPMGSHRDGWGLWGTVPYGVTEQGCMGSHSRDVWGQSAVPYGVRVRCCMGSGHYGVGVQC